MRALGEALVIDDVERRERSGAGDCVAAVGAAVRPRLEPIEQRACGENARQRQAGSAALGHDHDVGRCIGPLGGEGAPRAGVTGLDRVNGQGTTDGKRVYLPTELVIRSTTAPLEGQPEDRP